MVISHSCGLTSVSSSLAFLLGMKENSVRQRIREWCYAKEDKRGAGRCEIEVSSSFVPVLCWILSWWPAGEKRLAIAMDATHLGSVLVVLVISVVYRGCALPIAWRVLPSGQKGSWKEIWLDLFSHFQGVIPQDWLVIVMADRGLYAHWLWEAIQKCHWHPFLRINGRIFFRPKDGAQTAIAALQELGVKLKIITGDNHLVARNTGQVIGLGDFRVLSGSELDNLRDEALWHAVEETTVFAEVNPNQKERILTQYLHAEHQGPA